MIAAESAAAYGEVDHPSLSLFSGTRKRGRQGGLDALVLATIDGSLHIALERFESLETV